MQFGSNPKKNEDPVASLLEAIRIKIFGHGVPIMWKILKMSETCGCCE
jgi:hypothetical protein